MQVIDGGLVELRDGAPSDGASGHALGDSSVQVPDGATTEMHDGAPSDGSENTSGTPHDGAHALRFYHYRADGGAATITTMPMEVQPSGSTMIVGVGRGDITAFGDSTHPVVPTDNQGNRFQQLGNTQSYGAWPDSGTALYAKPSATGGTHYTVSTTNQDLGFGQYDEITLAAIEVVGGSRIEDYRWNEIRTGTLTSASVTTTGPATLVAFWWGDGYFYNPPVPQTATPDNGFVVVESNTQDTDSFVQCAVAVKNVSAAGSYNVTWTATPEQGAQMWLVAVQ